MKMKVSIIKTQNMDLTMIILLTMPTIIMTIISIKNGIIKNILENSRNSHRPSRNYPKINLPNNIINTNNAGNNDDNNNPQHLRRSTRHINDGNNKSSLSPSKKSKYYRGKRQTMNDNENEEIQNNDNNNDNNNKNKNDKESNYEENWKTALTTITATHTASDLTPIVALTYFGLLYRNKIDKKRSYSIML